MLTKNPDTPTVNPSWTRALRDFDVALRTQGMGEKTRRAYGTDLGQLAEWACGHGLDPRELDYRRLRRFAGVLSERGASKSTVARKLAAIRSFYRVLVQRGELGSSPADLVSSPKRDSRLPEVLKEAEVGGPSTPISPTGTSLHPAASREACRPVCRMQRVPMNTPRSRLCSTAYHIVDASLGPWIGCQGRGGSSSSSARPASISCLRVATRPS